ncbi:DUF4064 domain-containing protein [Bacillus cereus]|uniref:DUF4064 domain-containing protein n=1 Tax=Bacillus cereus TaxID=1396 RepID=UPI000BF48157|nr:DUF4064 domain-containing protein [Bacillus cereus]PFB15904.1 hypothetical protein CN408_23850 [Bacillus cereus]
MKRTAEFVLGLIGGIFGVIGSVIVMCLAIYGMEGYTDNALLTYIFIVLIIEIGLLVLACLVNKVNNIVYGVCIIVLSLVTLFMSLFTLIIPVILQIISGAIAFRTLKQK